jgi:hypothetical protein
LAPISSKALRTEDMEFARQNLFRRSSLTEPFQLVNVDVNSGRQQAHLLPRLTERTRMCNSLEFEDHIAGALSAVSGREDIAPPDDPTLPQGWRALWVVQAGAAAVDWEHQTP